MIISVLGWSLLIILLVALTVDGHWFTLPAAIIGGVFVILIRRASLYD